jgi:hypothetical protein
MARFVTNSREKLTMCSQYFPLWCFALSHCQRQGEVPAPPHIRIRLNDVRLSGLEHCPPTARSSSVVLRQSCDASRRSVAVPHRRAPLHVADAQDLLNRAATDPSSPLENNIDHQAGARTAGITYRPIAGTVAN